MTTLLLTPTVKVSGVALREAWMAALVDLRVEREYRTPARATLRFADPGFTLASSNKFTLGAEVVVVARDSGELIRGDVTGLGIDQDRSDSPMFLVTVHDRAYRMARSTTIDTYMEMTVGDVVSAVASRAKLTPAIGSGATTKADYLIQVDNDLALVDALADRTGCDWWVDEGALHFGKPRHGSTVSVTMGEELLTFTARASGLRPDKVKVSGWDRQEQQAQNGDGSAESAVFPSNALLEDFKRPGSHLGGETTYTTGAVLARSDGEASALGNAVLTRMAAASYTVRGTCYVAANIKLGCLVQVKNAGPASGEYPVTRVDHVYRRDGFWTHFTSGDRTPTSLVDMLGRASPNASPLHHVGLVVGQVTNINDEEKLGRVKVKFPGLTEGKESYWARVLGLGGGAERGQVFLPEVGDEVLVGFEGSDIRQPVVLGGLYGKKSTIPSPGVKEGKVAGRRITSRLGHVVELADGEQPSEQYILLALAGKEQKISFAKDKVDVNVPSGVPLTIKVGDSSLAFDKTGALAISASNITIKSKGDLTLEGARGVQVKGATLDLKGETQAGLKSVEIEINGSMSTAVKGGMVRIN